MDESLAGHVVVITGASSGFGRGVALAAARAGAHLVLAARREYALEDLSAECAVFGARAIVVPTDVARETDVEALSQAALREFGSIDVWVNNAGVAALGRFDDVPLADHAQVVHTNLLGVIYGSWFALRLFREQGRGVLINVASALGKLPTPYYGSYVASKHGIVGLDGALRQELELAKLDNIHICTVMPMSHDTPFFDHVANYSGHEVQPIPPLYDEQKVVDTVIRLMTHPEEEIIVGGAGKLINAAHNIMPDPVDKIIARTSHRSLITNSPPADDTAGNVADPIEEGQTVSGGRRVARKRTRRRERSRGEKPDSNL